MSQLASWYRLHGRHDLVWRHTTDRWAVLVSEVMLAQTQVQRVTAAWPGFMQHFPTVAVTAAHTPGDVIAAWGRLGYPRRAGRLWETAVIVNTHGWPNDYRALPGVGSYTAGALAAQIDNDPNAIGIDVNIRRVVQRATGSILSDSMARQHAAEIAAPLVGRDRLLALMDLGASLCTPRNPQCANCPLRQRCNARGPLEHERPPKQRPYKGSLRERRGVILADLRARDHAQAGDYDAEIVRSLLTDRLISESEGVLTLALD